MIVRIPISVVSLFGDISDPSGYTPNCGAPPQPAAKADTVETNTMKNIEMIRVMIFIGGIQLELDLGNNFDDRICETCDNETDESIDDCISSLLHLLVISRREDELDPSPCDRHDSEHTSDHDKILDNSCYSSFRIRIDSRKIEIPWNIYTDSESRIHDNTNKNDAKNYSSEMREFEHIYELYWSKELGNQADYAP
jgi:hypothetical protein